LLVFFVGDGWHIGTAWAINMLNKAGQWISTPGHRLLAGSSKILSES
jgi:hypothetical protein